MTLDPEHADPVDASREQASEEGSSTPTRRQRRGLLFVAASVAVLGYQAGLTACAPGIAGRTTSSATFDGAYMLALSDADMVATAYADGVLDRADGVEDSLTLLALPYAPADGQPASLATVAAPNSVINWPPQMDTDPAGRFIYVAETRGTPPSDVNEYDDVFEDFPEGSTIRVIRRNGSSLEVLEDHEVGTRPLALAVSPDGDVLAVTTASALTIYQLDPEGTIGDAIAAIDNTVLLEGLDGAKSAATAVAWHPTASMLVVNLNDNALRALRYEPPGDDSPASLTLHGDPIRDAGTHMPAGRFTPDGRFYLITDLKWDEGFLFNSRGELISVRFDSGDVADHRVVSRARVGVGPEGFDISPDGRLAATVNMRRTYLPGFLFFWPGRDYSSVSLVSIDSDSGELTTIDEYGFEGLLPEMLQFDADGDALAVGVYHDRERTPIQGRIEFWNVVGGDEPRLERTVHEIPVVRGLHDLLLVK